jgi:uncharacterized protein (DUF1501 family)
MTHAPSRRELLLASGTLFAWSYVPKLARAEGRDPRFLTIVLRGALDGLATVAPVRDPDWVSLRGDHALTLEGKTPAIKLDDFFALNPAMPNLARMFKANEAIIVHAAATSYRERSHFDGQDVLQSGVEKPGTTRTGWLNRLLMGLAPGDHVNPNGGRVFAVGPVTPLVVRGPAPMLSWSPRRIPPASDDTIARLLDLYLHTDVNFARVLEGRMKLAAIAPPDAMEQKPAGPLAAPVSGPTIPQLRAYFAEAVGTAGRSLMVRAWARWPLTAGTRTTTKASQPAGWRNCWGRSTRLSPPSTIIWARRGARPWWRSSPSSAARRASTGPTVPTTVPALSCYSPAARSKAAA